MKDREEYISILEQDNAELKKQLEVSNELVAQGTLTEMKLRNEVNSLRKEYQDTYKDVRMEIKEYKKQVEEYQKELEKADSITQSCIFNGKEESKISYRKCLNILDKKRNSTKRVYKVFRR